MDDFTGALCILALFLVFLIYLMLLLSGEAPYLSVPIVLWLLSFCAYLSWRNTLEVSEGNVVKMRFSEYLKLQKHFPTQFVIGHIVEKRFVGKEEIRPETYKLHYKSTEGEQEKLFFVSDKKTVQISFSYFGWLAWILWRFAHYIVELPSDVSRTRREKRAEQFRAKLELIEDMARIAKEEADRADAEIKDGMAKLLEKQKQK